MCGVLKLKIQVLQAQNQAFEAIEFKIKFLTQTFFMQKAFFEL